MIPPRCCDLCGYDLDDAGRAAYGFHAHELCIIQWEEQWLPGDRGTPREWSARCPDIAPDSRSDGRIVRKAQA